MRSTPRRSTSAALVALAALVTVASLPGCAGGCRTPRGYSNPSASEGELISVAPIGPFSLNRGDWLIGDQTNV